MKIQMVVILLSVKTNMVYDRQKRDYPSVAGMEVILMPKNH